MQSVFRQFFLRPQRHIVQGRLRTIASNFIAPLVFRFDVGGLIWVLRLTVASIVLRLMGSCRSTGHKGC